MVGDRLNAVVKGVQSESGAIRFYNNTISLKADFFLTRRLRQLGVMASIVITGNRTIDANELSAHGKYIKH